MNNTVKICCKKFLLSIFWFYRRTVSIVEYELRIFLKKFSSNFRAHSKLFSNYIRKNLFQAKNILHDLLCLICLKMSIKSEKIIKFLYNHITKRLNCENIFRACLCNINLWLDLAVPCKFQYRKRTLTLRPPSKL